MLSAIEVDHLLSLAAGPFIVRFGFARRDRLAIVDEVGMQAESLRSKWPAASERAADLAAELFQPGSGYGDPDARAHDEYRLDVARREADRLFREYEELDRRMVNWQLLKLQRSQQPATWASFVVAAVVGTATIVSVVVALLK